MYVFLHTLTQFFSLSPVPQNREQPCTSPPQTTTRHIASSNQEIMPSQLRWHWRRACAPLRTEKARRGDNGYCAYNAEDGELACRGYDAHGTCDTEDKERACCGYDNHGTCTTHNDERAHHVDGD